MIQQFEKDEFRAFTWIDVCEPSEKELNELVNKYHLPQSIIADCLAPEHLPKIEQLKESYFVIFRVFDVNSTDKSLSIRKLSRKIAVLVTPQHVFTIHRAPLPSIEAMHQWVGQNTLPMESSDFMAQLCLRVIDTFQSQTQFIQERIEHIEQKLFMSETHCTKLKSNAICLRN
jgi:magnesium transporter